MIEKALEEVLPKSQANSRLCFVSFAYADIPVGKEFEVVFPKESPLAALMVPSRIVAVTEQFLKPFDMIPHGWKTICLIEFPLGVPVLIDNLPIVNGWYQSRKNVCLASRETWLALTKSN